MPNVIVILDARFLARPHYNPLQFYYNPLQFYYNLYNEVGLEECVRLKTEICFIISETAVLNKTTSQTREGAHFSVSFFLHY